MGQFERIWQANLTFRKPVKLQKTSEMAKKYNSGKKFRIGKKLWLKEKTSNLQKSLASSKKGICQANLNEPHFSKTFEFTKNFWIGKKYNVYSLG